MTRRIPAFAAALALGFTLAAPLPLRAAEMLQVPATAGTPAAPIYVARPPGKGPFPAVLFLHGCAGFDGFLAVAADRLVPRGFVGIALDSLAPYNVQTACDDHRHDLEQAALASATLAWMRRQPYIAPDRLAIVGFSMGADAALDLIDSHAAPPPGVRVAVDFYPACEKRDGLVNVPLAIFDGDQDQVTPPAPCVAMVKAGTAAGKTLSITTYPGATHGFDVPGPDRTFFGAPIRFDPQAAVDAARQTLGLLMKYLSP